MYMYVTPTMYMLMYLVTSFAHAVLLLSTDCKLPKQKSNSVCNVLSGLGSAVQHTTSSE